MEAKVISSTVALVELNFHIEFITKIFVILYQT